MMPSADSMVNYREYDLKLRIADGSIRSTKGYSDVNFLFRSENRLVQVLLTNVAHVPDPATTYLLCPLSSKTVAVSNGVRSWFR